MSKLSIQMPPTSIKEFYRFYKKGQTSINKKQNVIKNRLKIITHQFQHNKLIKVYRNKRKNSIKFSNILQTVSITIMSSVKVVLEKYGKYIVRELMVFSLLNKCQKLLSFPKRVFQAL